MDEFNEKSKLFQDWLIKNNVEISPKIAIHDYCDTNQGRGIIALEDINPDEMIFKLPRSIVLNIDNNSLIKSYPSVLKKLRVLDQWIGLIIVLGFEIKFKFNPSDNNDNHNRSFWYEYLNILPDQFNQLIYWNDEELNHLQPSCILDRIDLSGVEEFKSSPLTFEEYNKVATIIMSYSFDVEKGNDEEDEEEDEDKEDDDDDEEEDNEYYKSMVPFADTLNADTHLNNAILIYSTDQLIMTCIKPIAKGEQVYNTYSDHPNSELLRRYGYVELNGSKYDFGEIPLSTIKSVFIDQFNKLSTNKNKSNGDTFMTKQKFDELLQLINQLQIKKSIEQDGLEEDEAEELILDSYDCFNSGDVIIELVFLIQVLSTILVVYQYEQQQQQEKDTDKKKEFEIDQNLINRIFNKIYQLIESKKITSKCFEIYQSIINARMSQYPDIAKQPFNGNVAAANSEDETINSIRIYMAEVVLKSEYQSLEKCSSTIKDFKIINDVKLNKNILKKRNNDTNGVSETNNKKSKN
ncbi:SET domain family protein [Candida albicans]|uniref:Ribosomal lysine N-methyltransferase 4 n=1 Tax=Candida albicans TaxID=5476 RepID=A0A8H6BRY2_CANAX|nr:SET domain family protein [Candida albicans]